MKCCKTALVAFVMLSFAFAVQAKTVYLMPLQSGEIRETQDGTSWATAYATVADAVSQAEEGDLIYAAKGVYVFTETVSLSSKTVQIYGGYSGTGDERDITVNPTIFTGDQDLDDIWQHVEPVLGEFTYTITDTDRKVITDDGKVSDPGAFTADYDGYAAKIVGTNTRQAFAHTSVASHFRVSGVTFTGFYGTDQWHGDGAIALDASSGAWGRFEDCTFTGNRPFFGVISVASNFSSYDFQVNRCTFAYNYSTADNQNAASCIYGQSAFSVNDCTFLCCSMFGSKAMGNCMHYRIGAPSINRCTFVRCDWISSSTAAGTYGRGNCVASWMTTSQLAFRENLVSNCLSASKFSGPGIAMFSMKYTSASSRYDFRSNVVTRCRVEAVPSAESVHSLVESYSGSHEMGFIDSSFVSNEIVAVSTTATSGRYLLSTVAFSQYSTALRAVNCTFDSNVIKAPEVSGVTAIKCRGVAWSGFSADAAGGANIGNCTFYGPAVSDVYDIAQVGDYCPNTFLVVNSILSSEGDRAGGIYAGVPAKMKVAYTSIKNHLMLDGVTYVELDTDEVPLVRGAGPLAAGLKAALYPAARAPGISNCNYTASYAVATYGFQSHDAAGNPRTQADALRGAINAYANGAGEKLALTIRRDPLLLGTLNPSGDVRAVSSGDPVSVTAVPAANAAFVGWYLTSGEPYGADPTNPKLSIAALDDDLVLVAKFESVAQPVELTFDLRDGGTFDASGTSTITVQAQPGTAFPDVPAYTLNSQYILRGWSPTLPDQVPAVATTYAADALYTGIRIIKVVPEADAPAVQNGKSWATAYTNIQTAVTDAGSYQGEVWFKEGTYTLGTSVNLSSNVRLRGGFAGVNENEEPDAELHPTVLTGDVSGNDVWTGGSTAKIWNDGVFTAPTLGTSPWYPTGNQSDNLSVGFATPLIATNDVFEGLTFTGFKDQAIYGKDGKGRDFRVRNCRFLANGGAKGNDSASLRIESAAVTVEDCRFVGNYHAFFAHNSGAKPVVTDCRFESNVSEYGGAAIHSWNGGKLYVTNCTFEAGWGKYDGWRCGAAISTYGSAVTIRIDNCRFLRNQVRDQSMGVIVPFEGDNVVITRSRFVGNNNVLPKMGQPRSGGVFGQAGGSLTVRDCEFTSNTNRVTTTITNPIGGILGGNGQNLFVNCTFDGNVHQLNFAMTGSTAMFVMQGGKLSFVHCTVNGSTLTTDCPEVKMTAGYFSAVNSLFENAAADYLPFVGASGCSMALSHSFVRNYDEANFVTGTYGFADSVATSGASVSAHPVCSGDFIHRTAVSTISPHGRNVWLVGNVPYIYDAESDASKPWRNMIDLSQRSASVSGLTRKSPLPVDAFGNVRRLGHPLQGPVEIKPGLAIIVK